LLAIERYTGPAFQVLRKLAAEYPEKARNLAFAASQTLLAVVGLTL
jgi:hypothetical protein